VIDDWMEFSGGLVSDRTRKPDYRPDTCSHLQTRGFVMDPAGLL
jgi:hypothetical protein